MLHFDHREYEGYRIKVEVTGTLEVSGSNAIEGSMSSKNDFKLLIKEIDGNVKINTTDAKEFFYGYPNLEIVRSLDTSMVKSMYLEKRY